MNAIDIDKLWSYLSFDTHLDTLMELWVKLGGIDQADQMGVAQHIVESYYPEHIVKILLENMPDVIPGLVSGDEDERKKAKELMELMGIT